MLRPSTAGPAAGYPTPPPARISYSEVEASKNDTAASVDNRRKQPATREERFNIDGPNNERAVVPGWPKIAENHDEAGGDPTTEAGSDLASRPASNRIGRNQQKDTTASVDSSQVKAASDTERDATGVAANAVEAKKSSSWPLVLQ
ncbi:hypothetical protein G7046_g1000 [Stylonectria norvegica]|nr:hypothetical protein G7046_g1000 [Stylonectria norvegica]